MGVGDDNQSIYAFLNNINLLKELSVNSDYDITIKTLTKSFRFAANSPMEKYANLILNYRGISIQGVANHENGEINDLLMLGRSNSQVFWSAFELSQKQKHFLLIGGIDNELRDFFYDIDFIMNGKTSNVKSKLLKDFNSIKELKSFALAENDQEILSAITLLKKLSDEGISLFQFFKSINKFNKNKFFINARPNPTFLSTIHKAKGLEFDEVDIIPKISDAITLMGFAYNITFKNKIVLKLLPKTKVIEEYNLLYVAVTRAKKELTINNEEVLINFSFLRSKMNYHKSIEISDAQLDTANSKFEYPSNKFIEVVIDNWEFYINFDEFREFKNIIEYN
jgi:superfamily I DNA/RNA helicase